MQCGLSLMHQRDFALAVRPLVDGGLVDMAEWTVDIGWSAELPAWLAGLLDHYAAHGRLVAHGTGYSPLSAGASGEAWLSHLAEELRSRPYTHVSEHFGFCATEDIAFGAPMPVPRTAETLEVGITRMRRLSEAARGLPVGLENLALAMCARDALEMGGFIEALVEPVDGFVLLDLHNLWCQIHNFGLSPDDLLASYPLHRVRQIHVSGGSWSGAPRVRRDTHDDAVPEAVWDLLAQAMPRCPNLGAVVLERLGSTLATEEARDSFRQDFMRMREVAA